MASEKTLATHTRKELAQLAKHNKVEGWHSMKKAELIDALKDRRLTKTPPKNRRTERSQALKAEEGDSARIILWRTTNAKASAEPEDSPSKLRGSRVSRLPANASAGECEKLWATPQGAHWISASWRLSPEILNRAEASLGRDWHLAKPVLRVFDVNCSEETCPSKCCVANLPIHGGVDYWYVPIADPSRTYELQIGYETAKGQFFLLARSACLKLPQPGSPQARKYEEQRQESASENLHRFPIRGAAGFRDEGDVSLEVDADLFVVGQVSPHARLTCQEDPVPVRPDGTFEVRLTLDEGRQVIPLEAVSPDGCQSRTMILAIDRNTKTLAPQFLNEWE